MVPLGIVALLYSKVHAVLECLEIHSLLQGTYPIITSPRPGSWPVYTHFGIPHVKKYASQLPLLNGYKPQR